MSVRALCPKRRLIYGAALAAALVLPSSTLRASTEDQKYAASHVSAPLEKPQAEKAEIEKTIFLQPKIKDLPSSRKTFDALDVSGQIFLPLKDAVQLLEFPIEFNAENSEAHGSFFAPQNGFSLDVAKREVRFGDKHREVTRRDIRRHGDQIYISTESFAEWFGIKSDIDRSKYTLHFTTDRLLFQEAKEERRKKWRMLSTISAANDAVTSRSFRGDAAPGSDVELYRDSELIAGRAADQAGHYEFTDIPVRSGKNVFRTSLYDLYGGYEERVETVTGSAATAVKGSLPNAGSTEKDKNRAASDLASGIAKPAPVASATTNNWVTLKVVRDKRTLGAVEAYLDKQNTFVRLKTILGLLGLSYNRQETADTAEIVLKDGSRISLDFQKRDYVQNNKHYSFYYYDTYKKENEVYANIELLNRLLPQTGLVVDLGLQQVDVSAANAGIFGFLSGKDEANKADLAPAPQAAPVQPVIIDDLTGSQRTSGSPVAPPETSPEAKDVLHITESDQGSPKTKKEAAPPEGEKKEGEELLILQPRIKDFGPSDEFIESLDLSGQIFLPLKDMIHLFEFPIKVDKDNATASGFFFSSDNVFLLDVDKREVRVADKHLDVTLRDIRRHEGQIYISSESFAEWFGIKSVIDRSKSTIHFMTEHKLPQEEKEERQKRWSSLLREVDKSEKDPPVLQNPYQAFGYPAVDVNIGTVYTHAPSSESGSSSSAKSFLSNYNVQGAGDIAYLTGKFYAQGTTDGSALSILRLQAGRKDNEDSLLGPMYATEFEFGDVSSPSLSLVTNNSLGRGATITNRSINASENFDFRNFTGDSIPGYEVELYRNDVLVSFQTVDSTGRYNFTNIPILYGENIFRIVFYGQQGQREERVETVSAASSLLKEHQFVYTLGVEQRGESLLPVGSSQMATPNNPIGVQAVGDFRYGLTRDVTAGAAVAETTLKDGTHRYVDASMGANIFGVLAEANFAHDTTNNGWAASAVALGGFEGVSLRLRHRTFENFLSEAINNTTIPLSSDTSFDANTQLLLPILGSYSVGLSALRENFVDASLVPRTTYSWRSSKSIGGISFTDSVDYVIDQQKRFQDTFGVQTRVLNADIRAVGIMDVKPTQHLREASFMADYQLMDKVSAQTQVDKNLISNQTTLGQNFNWDFDEFRLSFTSQLGDNGGYAAGLNFIFSLNHDPVTNAWHAQPRQTSDSGAISGRVYIDENNNHHLDDGEKIFSDAKIKVNNVLVKPDVDDFFVTPVSAYQTNRVEVDAASIADPLLTPAVVGYNVLTRPGDSVIADFPLVRTTIIDGSVVFLDDKGNKHELSNVVVELEDTAGKPLHRVISAIDGYFSFDKIQTGEYWLTIPEEALNAVNASLDKKISIRIEKIDEFLTGNEITLHQKARLDTPPPMPALPAPPQPSMPSSESPAAGSPQDFEQKTEDTTQFVP